MTTYTYDDVHHTTAVTDPLGRVTTSAYDARGRLLAQTNALGGVTSYTYDASGHRLTVTVPLGPSNTIQEYAPGANTAVFTTTVTISRLRR